MAIAGVEPVGYATSELGGLEHAETVITDNAMLPISILSGTQLYTDEQVRDILIKFSNSKNAMHRDMKVEQIVDEFMANN